MFFFLSMMDKKRRGGGNISPTSTPEQEAKIKAIPTVPNPLMPKKKPAKRKR